MKCEINTETLFANKSEHGILTKHCDWVILTLNTEKRDYYISSLASRTVGSQKHIVCVLILSLPCVIINVFRCTNYDNTDLRILFTFGITSLDAFRCLLCTPSSGALNCFYFRFSCPFPTLCMSCSSEWFKRCKTCTSLSQYCTKHFYT
jgi:hypothetical protein